MTVLKYWDAGSSSYKVLGGVPGTPGATGPTGPQGTAGTTGIAFSYSGKPAVSAKLIVPIVAAMTLPANLVGSVTRYNVAPAASAVFNLTQMLAAGGTTALGTITIPTSGAATYSTSAATLAVGDALMMTAPGTQDTALDTPSITLAATKQ